MALGPERSRFLLGCSVCRPLKGEQVPAAWWMSVVALQPQQQPPACPWVWRGLLEVPVEGGQGAYAAWSVGVEDEGAEAEIFRSVWSSPPAALRCLGCCPTASRMLSPHSLGCTRVQEHVREGRGGGSGGTGG